MMTKVFIGGSRKISRLNADVQSRLDRIIERHFPILVGDANGADKAVQTYLRKKGYSQVEVFCTGNECRNNHGDWPVRSVFSDAKHRSFEFYSSKDRAMADEASVGLMIWDGKSKGTLMNVLRLINAGKKVAVYVSSSKNFVDLKTVDDWNNFNSAYVTESRESAERQGTARRHSDEKQHPALL